MSSTEDKAEPLFGAVAHEAHLIPAVGSPYDGRKITVPEHLALSAYWFATNFLWGALLVIMLPGEIRQMAPYYRVPALGLLTMLSAVVALAVPLVVGALSDRCASKFGRRRPYIVSGLITNLVGLSLMFVAFSHGRANPIPVAAGQELGGFATYAMLLGQPTFLLFLGAYMCVQLGNNIASAAYCGIIPDLVPHSQRGAASGYMALMSQMGTLFGAIGCGLLLHSAPERDKYLAVGTALALVAMATIFGIRETPLPRKPPKIDWGWYVKSLWIDPKQYPDFAWVWITRFLVMLGFYSVLPFVNYYFVDVIGLPDPDGPASKLTGIILIASSITGVVGGYISDRVGRKKVVYVANSAIAVMALAFIFCRSVPEVLIAGVFFGFGFGAYTSVDWALGADVLPSKKDAGKEMAVWHIAMTLPQTIAAPVAGYLIAAFGKTVLPPSSPGDQPVVHYAVAGYSAMFVFVALCFAAGAYLLKNVRGVK